MFALNLCSISELLVKKSERTICENRRRGNILLGEQHYWRSSEHSEIPQKAQEAYKLDKVDQFCGSAARKDAKEIFYLLNSALKNVSLLNIQSLLGKLGNFQTTKTKRL